MTNQAENDKSARPAPKAPTGASHRARAGCLFLMMALGAACAGPKYQVNDVVLSDLPLQDKERMLAVKGEMNQATEEKNKAQSDVATDDRDISVAQAESSQSRLESGKQEANLRLAERGQDLNRIGPAKASLDAANNPRHVSGAKLSWLQQRRDFHVAQIEVAELHGVAAERRYELEKARLAQATGKLPSKNFSVGQFEEQSAKSQQKYEQARARAGTKQLETVRLEQAYTQLATSRPQS
jgi:chromosome segregation ATPase